MHEDSGIPLDVIAERGYRTVASPAELIELGFADYQARTPALLIPLHGPDGSNGRYAIKPDCPRTGRDGKVRKYDYPAGWSHMLDVPPGCASSVLDPSVPLMFTEGAKKADCATGLGYCAINIWGTSAWYTNPEHRGFATIQPLPDWQPILETLDGRICYLVYDSDAWRNPNVARELRRLANWLTRHGALVFIVHLPDEPDDSKNGLDDFVTRHGAEAFRELVEDAEPWGSVAMVRKLQAELQDARRQLHALARLRRDPGVSSAVLRASWAIADEIGWRRSTGAVGPCEVNRDRMAEQSGLSNSTIGKTIEQMASAPGSPITKSVKWREVGPGERHKVLLLDTVEPNASAADLLDAFSAGGVPVKVPHGGKRTPHCPYHLDAALVSRETVLHFDCGCVIPQAEALLVEVNEQDAPLLSDDERQADAEPSPDAAEVKEQDALLVPARTLRSPLVRTKHEQDALLLMEQGSGQDGDDDEPPPLCFCGRCGHRLFPDEIDLCEPCAALNGSAPEDEPDGLAACAHCSGPGARAIPSRGLGRSIPLCETCWPPDRSGYPVVGVL